MSKQKINFIPLAFTSGVIATIGLILYFLLMRLFDLTEIVWLHMFNFAIIAGVIYWSLNRIRTKYGSIDYFNGLMLGATVSFITAVLFSIFIYVYSTTISPEFVTGLEDNLPFGEMGEPASISIALWIETLIGGSIIGFIVMQWLKNVPEFQEESHHQT